MKNFFLFFVCSYSLYAHETVQDIALAKVSESLGHLIAKHLLDTGISFDFKAIADGIQKEELGVKAPLSEEECTEALLVLEEQKKALLAQENLQLADAFLLLIAKKQEVHSLESGQVHYVISKEGSGEEVQAYNTPLLRYKSAYLDSKETDKTQVSEELVKKVFGGALFATPSEEEYLVLEETTAGLRQGIVGMKEGETRVLFIHPFSENELQGNEDHPNALLIVEIELLRADSALQEELPASLEEVASFL